MISISGSGKCEMLPSVSFLTCRPRGCAPQQVRAVDPILTCGS